jgi:hypothetical protein
MLITVREKDKTFYISIDNEEYLIFNTTTWGTRYYGELLSCLFHLCQTRDFSTKSLLKWFFNNYRLIYTSSEDYREVEAPQEQYRRHGLDLLKKILQIDINLLIFQDFVNHKPHMKISHTNFFNEELYNTLPHYSYLDKPLSEEYTLVDDMIVINNIKISFEKRLFYKIGYFLSHGRLSYYDELLEENYLLKTQIKNLLSKDVQPRATEKVLTPGDIQPQTTDRPSKHTDLEPQPIEKVSINGEVQPKPSEKLSIIEEVQPKLSEKVSIIEEVQPKLSEKVSINGEVRPKTDRKVSSYEEVRPKSASKASSHTEIRPKVSDDEVPNKVVNPKTGKKIQVGGKVYQSLLKEGYSLVKGTLVKTKI